MLRLLRPFIPKSFDSSSDARIDGSGGEDVLGVAVLFTTADGPAIISEGGGGACVNPDESDTINEGGGGACVNPDESVTINEGGGGACVSPDESDVPDNSITEVAGGMKEFLGIIWITSVPSARRMVVRMADASATLITLAPSLYLERFLLPSLVLLLVLSFALVVKSLPPLFPSGGDGTYSTGLGSMTTGGGGACPSGVLSMPSPSSDPLLCPSSSNKE